MISSTRLSSKQNISLLISLMLLSAQLNAADWQAAGNMTDYLPTIRGFMDVAIENKLHYSEYAINISNECNSVWDQFWNVYVFWLRLPNFDMILYGYAFRNHWYWHNNYGPDQQSFAIWKDYNCKTKFKYFDVLDQEQSGNSMIRTAFQSAYDNDNGVVLDVWKWARDAIENHLYDAIATSRSIDKSTFGISGAFINLIPTQYSERFCDSDINFKASDTTPVPYFFSGFINRLDDAS